MPGDTCGCLGVVRCHMPGHRCRCLGRGQAGAEVAGRGLPEFCCSMGRSNHTSGTHLPFMQFDSPSLPTGHPPTHTQEVTA